MKNIMVITMMQIMGKRSSRLWFAWLAIVFVVVWMLADASARSKEMNSDQAKLWGLIDSISKSIPFDRAFLEAQTSLSLKEVDRSETTVFYEGQAGVVAGKNLIGKVDFRHRFGDFNKSLLVLGLARSVSCIDVDQVKMQFGNLERLPLDPPPMLIPGQRLIEDSTYINDFGITRKWGRLSFSFESKDHSRRDVGCLKSVIFSFAKQ